jgi:hypothetical protein
MGYRLTARKCSTLCGWSKKGGASGAHSIHFAPLLHLLHPVVQQTGGGGATAIHLPRARSTVLRRHHGRLAPTACRPWRSPTHHRKATQ